VTDTATLSGGFSPTRSITFTVYFNDNTCTSSAFFSSTVPVAGNGNYPSGAFTPMAAGTYYWTASYIGDSNNNGFTTACGALGETLTVIKASPSVSTSVSISASPTPIVADSASLSGGFSPTGSITITVYNTATCSAGSVISSSTVTVSGNGLYKGGAFALPIGVGTYYWTASYSGDPNNNGFTTSCGVTSETLTADLGSGGTHSVAV
jgi:hypothetical protein